MELQYEVDQQKRRTAGNRAEDDPPLSQGNEQGTCQAGCGNSTRLFLWERKSGHGRRLCLFMLVRMQVVSVMGFFTTVTPILHVDFRFDA
jgi:hypothetical protein